jgi:hypothetical protein
MAAKRKKKPKPKPQSREQIVAETIEEAMAPYLGVLPKEALETMRDILEEAMATHPVALAALDALDAQAAPDRSGTRARDHDDDGPEGVA